MFSRKMSFVATASISVGLSAALADGVVHEFGVSDCKAGTVVLRVERPGVVVNEFPIQIPHDMTAQEKRDTIATALDQIFEVEVVGTNKFRLFSASDETQVSLLTGNTAEFDTAISADADRATIFFSGPFSPFSLQGQPAMFSAGIITDVGEFTAHVSAQELNFQTDGPIICQALFQRLAPQAPQHGAQILFAGDRLEVYFDPAYSITQGGIEFGTTSQSPGCGGSVHAVAPPRPPCPGDVDGDGEVDLTDLSILLAHYGMAAGATESDGDMNGDGAVGLTDLSIMLANFGAQCN